MVNLTIDNYKLPKKHEELVSYIEENWNGARLIEVEKCDGEFWLTFILDKDDNRRAFQKFVAKTVNKRYDKIEDKLSVVIGSLLGV